MRILVDVNVYIDVMTKRTNWEESLRVLNLVRRSPEIEGWTSALTVPLLYFFRLRVADERRARADAQAVVQGFRLVPLGEEILHQALASALPDFEDNIQLASAEAIPADHVITRNKKDFQPAQISILTPEEWLALGTVASIEADLHR
ncbi:MAG TPA: PIN domain-containing protein [Alphaproteobacteria bacterium]|nr:PIN domain-containing protein [Alphaproteobacteria bacterium]